MNRLVFSAAAGRFPGAQNLEEYWNQILAAQPAAQVSLPERWGIPSARIFDSRGGGNRVSFDKGFCLDATNLDQEPWGRQVRLGSEVLCELQEQANLEGAKTGLLLANSQVDESYLLAHQYLSKGKSLRRGLPFDYNYQLEAIAASAGLNGPKIAVDNACASFGYAVAIAAELLKVGEAESMVVMGLNAYLPAHSYLGYSQLSVLSPSGSLPILSDESIGMVPGECVAAVLLEWESVALATGRRILGVLGSVGLSSHGNAGSLQEGQRSALERAYVEAAWQDLDYLECHATGVPEEDAAELRVIADFLASRGQAQPVSLGSVKALVGHSLAASGAASLIKVLLMLDQGIIPPHPSVEPSRVLSNCPWLDVPFVPREFQETRPMRVGLSSFGFGGANAHLCLEGYLPSGMQPSRAPERCRRTSFDVLDLEAAIEDPVVASDYFIALERNVSVESGFAEGAEACANPRLSVNQTAATQVCRLLDRAGIKSDQREQMGITFFCNSGGSRFAEACRKVTAHFIEGGDEAPNLTPEEAIPLMSNVVSGSAAYLSNCRGFHQTLSGGAQAFLHGLSTLSGKQEGLFVVGAGRCVGSPSDLLSVPSRATLREGVATFLLRKGAGPQRGVLAHVEMWMFEGEDTRPSPREGSITVEIDTLNEQLLRDGEAVIAFALLEALAQESSTLEIRRKGRLEARFDIRRLRPMAPWETAIKSEDSFAIGCCRRNEIPTRIGAVTAVCEGLKLDPEVSPGALCP